VFTKTIVAISAVALSAHAVAQYRQPTEQEIERAKQQYRQPTDAEVNAAKKKYFQPPEAQLDRAAASQSPVNLDAIPMPKGKIDVEGLARAYEQNRQAFEKDKGYASDQPVLFVFVTLGMPEQTLRFLIDQAARTRAVMVLRGLKNASIRQTATHVQQLIGQKQVEWLIDPQAFDRFGVNQAPTFVLVKALAPINDCASGSCIAPNAFAAIAGDVSIDYALEAIERRAPRFSPEAQLFLKRIRG
jgi:conjugal transfer pilus assembly protein TrbC